MDSKKQKKCEDVVQAIAHTIHYAMEDMLDDGYDFILLVAPKKDPGFNALVSNIDHNKALELMEKQIYEYKKRTGLCSIEEVRH